MSTLPVSRHSKVNVPSPQVVPPSRIVIFAERDLLIPGSAHTLAGFRAWAKSDDFPECGRISFLDREIYVDMSPEELETHNQVKVEVERTLANLNKKRKLGKLYGDRTLITNEEANLSTKPDGTFITWETLESGRARLVPREGEEDEYLEIEGTPDWVLEIIRKSSVVKDTRRLRERYHAAGISEYWLIDARGEQIEFQILIREKDKYVVKPGRGGWQTSPLFRCRFRLFRRRGRMGLWEYTLQTKSLR